MAGVGLTVGDLVDAAAGAWGNAAVTACAIDHRKVAPGTIFGAFPGARANGEDYIDAAVAAGAVAVVARPQARVDGALHIADANPRRRFAALAARVFAPFPAVTVAATGTNGKTSCVELTRQLWQLAGQRAASIGTLGVTTGYDRVGQREGTGGLTTPDIVTFLATMAGLAREGISHAAFEASSHGLDQYRTEGLPVTAAAFTNLSRDHLDYHGTMDAYFAAKARLFSEVVSGEGTAVIWADDGDWSAQMIAIARARGLSLMTVGEAGTALRLINRTSTALGQDLIVDAGGERHAIGLPLIGAYQAANALVAAGLVIATGGRIKPTLGDLARVQGVRGRLERAVITRTGAAVYVDYAHTPDAIVAACAALRPHVTGRLILVLGAGGDRDAGKRPLMGEAAAAHADVVIVTDDNPRSEDPASIRAALLRAAPHAQGIADRRRAVAHAITMALGGDVVVVAGKGHEQGQIVGTQVLPFDDVTVARECAA